MSRSLLSNPGLALLAISRRPDSRIRDVAAELRITERAAQAIVSDLVARGYLRKVREGRRNRYEVLVRPDAGSEGPPSIAPDASSEACRALVLACGDYRIQSDLLRLLGGQGLLAGSELILWPGGGPALAGSHRSELLDALARQAEARRPSRFLLVSHAGCEVPEVPAVAGATPAARVRSIRLWARRIVAECVGRVGMTPELWFIDGGRFARISLGAWRPLARDVRQAASDRGRT